MFQPFVELAISKGTTREEVDALASVLRAAIELDDEERSFEGRINTNKALRGDHPTKQSRRGKASVDAYTTDAAALEAQQLEEFCAFASGSEILGCLAPALSNDIAFWQSSYRHAHPSDLSILQSLVDKKLALRHAIQGYLSDFPAPDS